MSDKPDLPKSNTNAEASKQIERMKKLRQLHSRRNEARQKNHQEVLEESKRSKLPANWEAKKARADWILETEAQREEAARLGKDYSRSKLLEVGADEAERKERRNQKKNPDKGFADFEQATFRQYSRLVQDIKPNMEEYEKDKANLGDAFYAGKNTIVHGLHKDSPEAMNRMVEDLHKQIEKREKYSRRRRHDDDAEIDYINERNMRFNKKLDRFYGEFTTEIKQNLERGTAI
ncbi:pre-mRNA-splicing factor SYF2-like [Daphnia magna]|nr:pre-mRNA-splicing factor SYF2-like [Daphnia magna]CAG4639553.1 EOG090X0ECA [Daphnia magna]